MIDLVHLRTFLAVIQEAHLSRAAERLHISQPTASQHIRALEERFGLPLFVRNSKGLTPTSAGLKLYENSKEIIASVIGLDGLLKSMSASLQGHLVIGTVYEQDLLERLTKFSSWVLDKHPLVNLYIENRNSNAVINGLKNGEIDIGFFLGNEHPEGLDAFPVKHLDFHLSYQKKWSHIVNGLDWKDISQLPWILMPEENPVYHLTKIFLREKGISALNKSITVSNNALMKQMIKDGVGIGFLQQNHHLEDPVQQEISCHPSTVITTKLLCGYLNARKNHPVIKLCIQAMSELALVNGD